VTPTAVAAESQPSAPPPTPQQIAQYVQGGHDRLRRAIRACGTTFSDFQDAHGVTGSYQRYLRVYDREAEPCPRCGTTLAGVHFKDYVMTYCPEEQTGGKVYKDRRLSRLLK